MLSRRGYRVVTVESAAQALDEVGQSSYDLVITDVVMPGMDGLTLTEKLRERDPAQEIILVSARPDMKGSAMALKVGVAVVLTKPVDETDLLLATERALERAQLRH